MASAACPMSVNTLKRSSRRLRPFSTLEILRLRGSRSLSTLPENPQIYVHKHPLDPSKSLLSLLPSSPPTPQLAIGSCTTLPVTPNNFTPNPTFLPILSSVYATHASTDPYVIQQASVFASPGGFSLSGPSSGAGAANHQGGAGGAGHGGFIHISDLRNPPDFGRIAWPEDIIGSVEVDGNGKVSEGTWQDSGTYRIVTREGILGLTEYMRGKMVERLQALEKDVKQKS